MKKFLLLVVLSFSAHGYELLQINDDYEPLTVFMQDRLSCTAGIVNLAPGLHSIHHTVTGYGDETITIYRGLDGRWICSLNTWNGRLRTKTTSGYCCTAFKPAGEKIVRSILVRQGPCY